MASVKKTRFDITMTRGDTYNIVFDVSKLTTSDLTCAYMTCKEKDAPEGTAKFCKKLSDSGIAKISSGKYKISLARADTINLDVDGQYMYDVEVKYDNEIKTIMCGCFKLLQDYTTPNDEESDT